VTKLVRMNDVLKEEFPKQPISDPLALERSAAHFVPLERISRLLITGSRVWPASLYALIWEDCHSAEHLILGDCPTGTDLWARRFAEFYQRSHTVHVADWSRLGGNAGPVRNQAMVDDFPVFARGYLCARAPNRGTNNCLSKLRRAGVAYALRCAR